MLMPNLTFFKNSKHHFLVLQYTIKLPVTEQNTGKKFIFYYWQEK